MKKLMIICLILALSVFMIACSGDNSKTSSSEAYTSVTPSTPAESLSSVEESAPIEASGDSAVSIEESTASAEESVSSAEESASSSEESSSSTEESTSSAA